VWRLDLYGDRMPAGAVARLGTVRWRQWASTVQLAFSPDGRTLLGSGGAGRLVVWDAATGKIVHQIEDPSIDPLSPFYRFALSSDGKTLVSQDTFGRALFWWDLASGRRLAMSTETDAVAQGQRQSIHVLALSPDGSRTAVGVRGGMRWRKDAESTVLFFDRPAAKSVRRLRFVSEELQSLAFSPDGKQVTGLFLTTDGFIVRRIDTDSGRIQQTLPVREAIQARLSSDGAQMAVYDETEELSIWDTSTGKKQKLGSARDLAGHELSFAAQNRVLLAFVQDRPLVQRFDTRTGKKLSPVPTGVDLGRWASNITLSPNGKIMALSNGPSAVALVDVETGKRRDSLPGLTSVELPGLTHGPAQLAFSTDGRCITTLSDQDGLIRWNAATGKQLLRVPAGRVDSLLKKTGILGHSGELLVQPTWRTVEVLAMPSRKRLNDWRIPEQAVGLAALSPDDKTLAMLGKDGILRFWELPWGKPVAEATPEKRIRQQLRMLFSPDGRTLALIDGPHSVELWDVPSGRQVGIIHAREDYSDADFRANWDVCYSGDGRKLYSTFRRHLQVWDVAARRELKPLVQEAVPPAPSEGAVSLAISPDDRFLVRVNGKGKLSLLETASGEVIHRFPGQHGAVAFAPAGWRLAAEDRVSLTVPIFDLPLLFLSLPPLRPEGSSAERLWSDLAHANAARAQRAAWEMTRIDGVETLLAGKLSPVTPAVGKRVAALIAELGNDEFTTRNRAEQDLADMRDSARKALETALQPETDLEIRYRLRRLLQMITAPSPRLLQELRAVMVLEARGTPAARQLLRRLAGGLPEARLTEEAAAALRRLK
jgi:WD40 repeat protein